MSLLTHEVFSKVLSPPPPPVVLDYVPLGFVLLYFVCIDIMASSCILAGSIGSEAPAVAAETFYY